jgi:hypothetical protein
MGCLFRRWRLLALVAAGLLLAGVAAWWFWPDGGDPRLAAYVHARPPVPVVFTSRSHPESFRAAAPEGAVYAYPGQRLWQATEGRLRLLTPRGTVHELTWGKPLPDGSTLIDVMSPSVSLDGTKVIFAGRKGPPDHGHFRIYEVGIDGRGLRQLTGGPDDPGCTAVPPLRYRNEADGRWLPQTAALSCLPTPGLPVNLALTVLTRPSLLADEQRKAVDYDDVDPIYLPAGRIVFVSTRIPDLGRGHARRASHVWMMNADGSNKHPMSANRNNDRWPFLTSSVSLTFSMWSRNTEVIVEGGTDLRPYREGMDCETLPTDLWQAALLAPGDDRFGMLIKPQAPVWRPRPLFNGRIAFMTDFRYGDPDPFARLEVVQAPVSLLQAAPSSNPRYRELPKAGNARLLRGPVRDPQDRPLVLATPSPCPDDKVLLAGAVREADWKAPEPGRWALYLASQDWPSADGQPVSAEQAQLQLLFDDPDLVDAEPAAVYVRPFTKLPPDPAEPSLRERTIQLANGRSYAGPAGQLVSGNLYQAPNEDFPGQHTDAGHKPIFHSPPFGAIDHVRFYASYRDRFDDPLLPRREGGWELILKAPLQHKMDSFDAWLPSGVPFVLAGFTADGKVASWETKAVDAQGRHGRFYAYAGDHYSSVRPGVHQMCVGCHAGHSGQPDLDHTEKRR